MRYKIYPLLAALAFLSTSCRKDQKDDQVVSQTYIHKYGYAVSEQEWKEKNYPGQVISTLRNGSMIAATYEDGELHGPCTFTYPHSQTVEKYILYNRNSPVKEIFYDQSGMPTQETVQLSQNRSSLTTWYSDGVPKSIEEYTKDELIEGQYFTLSNELEARVEKGKGTRIIRDVSGILVCKDVIENGYLVKRESFYPNGSPECLAFYEQGALNGERKTFTIKGEPLAVEQWVKGHLHGISTYYKNGTKELEISYLYGKKNGWEQHFVDGETLCRQIAWDNDIKHGPEIFFVPEGKKILWHYNGREVSQNRYQEMTRLDEMISEALE
jgi:antitoxin component YwqK of YwqJK toxin-antitoxin module